MEDETKLLFEIPAVTPLWVRLKNAHGIRCTYMERHDKVAAIRGPYYQMGDDERHAVIALIHFLRLDGWESVSIEQ